MFWRVFVFLGIPCNFPPQNKILKSEPFPEATQWKANKGLAVEHCKFILIGFELSLEIIQNCGIVDFEAGNSWLYTKRAIWHLQHMFEN